MNIGFLSPRSNAHPSIGLDFTAGFRLYLKHCGKEKDVKLFTESVGFGGSEKEVYEKAEKLLMADDVDILLAFIDERVMELLKPLLYASQKLMIVINAGANYPLNWVPQENIIHLTLQHAFCNWLSGAAAAKTPGNEAATATSFYDCGYLHAASVVKSYVKKEGQISFNFVNNDKYDESFSLKPLTDFLAQQPTTDKILCTLDELPASLFYAALDKETQQNKLHLFVSPMMLEQKALENAGKGFAFSITGYNTWIQRSEEEQNKIFIAACVENKKNVSLFSLLGWEAGILTAHLLEHAGENLTDGAALAEKLKAITFKTPRGKMILDKDTNFFIPPVYKYSMSAGDTEFEINEAGNVKEEWINFINEPTQGAVSGWTNTYLCY